MKNKRWKALLAGLLAVSMIGGMTSAAEFSDGVNEKVNEEMAEQIEMSNAIIEFESSSIAETEDVNEESEEADLGTEEFTLFTSENVELLTASDEETEIMLEAIESGEILAVAPVNIAEIEGVETFSITSEEGISLTAVTDTSYTIISGGAYYCDEVWSLENAGYPSPDTGFDYVHPNYRQCTVHRTIQYTDAEGNVKKSPLYCLNATKSGVNPGSGGEAAKEEAISLITNSTMKKILYFGYGGPGDICEEYDPTCKHIDWSKISNRYIFTHLALSIVYSGDAGYATDSEVEHVGLNKFIGYLKSLVIPNRKAVKLYVNDSEGNVISGSSISVDMSLYRTYSENSISGLASKYADGYQITPLIHIKDEADAGNGIRFSSYESDDWQILYWKTEEEYTTTRGENKPHILEEGKSVLLKDGASFRIVFPEEYNNSKKFTYEMSLYPVSYIMINGNTQSGSTGFQNMGAYVYQDTKGSVKLTVNPAPMGDLKISKTSDYDGAVVKGAEFTLKAAQDLYSGDVLIYEKNEVVETGITNKNGILIFENLIPGKYKVQETGVPDGYLKDASVYSKKVSNGKVTTVDIVNIPDLQGYVEIEKLVEGTKLHLSDAKFTIYSWSEKKQDYSGTIYQMSYDSTTKKYLSPILRYSADNKGKFQIVETKNPQGYSGIWSKEITLKNKQSTQKFSYVVENSPETEKRLEIKKVCSETGKTLKDAVFTLYEYSKKLGDYKTKGVNLTYSSKISKYVSEELQITDDNLGKYKVVETKNPDGYTGQWEKEINLMDISQTYQFVAKNTPIVYPKGSISIKKMDNLTGEILDDAEFTIYMWEETSKNYLENPFDSVLMKYDSDKEIYLAKDLEITPENRGKFKIVETKNPEGYSGTWEKEVVLTEEKLELYLEVENEPDNLPLGKITVVKKIKEDEIVWAHGNPTFHFIVEGVDLYGKYHRYENYVCYMSNSYTVDESGYAVLNCVFSKIPIGEYQVYEHSVSRYYLEDAIANTSNTTIVKGMKPAYGIEPKDIAYGIVKLSVSKKTGKITFINKKQRYDDYSHNDVIKNVMSSASILQF